MILQTICPPTSIQESLIVSATLAASSHNSQPWLFDVDHDTIRILPDFQRRCPVVDPDDHHLFVSLGCAAENLAVAAGSAGFDPVIEIQSLKPATTTIDVRLVRGSTNNSPLSTAIAQRHCTRAAYDGRTVSSADLVLLEQAARGVGVSPILLTDSAAKANVADWVAQGNTTQLEDPSWRKELVSWLRFNEREARRFLDGLWSRTTGNPDVPRALGKLGLPLFLNPRVQNGKDVPWTRGSAGVMVFVSEEDEPRHWIEVGRCYERFALQATALGICSTFINQPVEVSALRQQFSDWLGTGVRRPDLVVRFGYGPPMPRSLRRPVRDVLVARGGHHG